MDDNNCPFHARHFVWWGTSPPLPTFSLLNAIDNQCALVFGANSPCIMEIDGVDWRTCPRVAEIRIG